MGFQDRRHALQVNYNYDEYDRTIKDAIRGGKNEMWPTTTRPQKDFSRYVLYLLCSKATKGKSTSYRELMFGFKLFHQKCAVELQMSCSASKLIYVWGQVAC